MSDAAIIFGAGIGGLLAAGVLARHFPKVILLEKDPIPDPVTRPDGLPRPRKGVPQGPQVHAILKHGENVIAEIFPEFRQRLLAAGGTAVNVGRDLRIFEGGGWHPIREMDLVMHTQTRALLEQVIRDCLAELPNVEFRGGQRFEALTVSTAGAVTGARSHGPAGEETLTGPLVVDAMGRGSPLPKWLAAQGFGQLARSRAGISVHYVTVLLRQPAAWRGKANAWVLRATAPEKTRGATMFTIEGGRWLLTLVSRFGDLPPLDFPGCLAFAKSLEGGVIYDLIRNAEVDTAPRRFMIPEALLAHFDELEKLPAGLLPLGDVVGNFNPLQAQGMTIAALHAERLGQLLAGGHPDQEGFQALSCDYVRAAVEISRTAWHSAVNADFSYPETEGARPPDLAAQQYFRRALREAIESDAELHRHAIEVQQMLRPGAILARPEVLARAQALAEADAAD